MIENPMNDLRCQHPDSFVLAGKWEKTALTWKLVDALPTFSATRQREAVRDALAEWGRVTPLTFAERMVAGRSDIDVSFYPDQHGDHDFSGSTIAHAYIPDPTFEHFLEGDMHFRINMPFGYWTGQQAVGGYIDFQSVALHEGGHALGMGHSNVMGSVMYPYYSGIKHRLHADDVAGIQAIYGAATPPPGPAPKYPPDMLWPTPDHKFVSSGFYGSRSWGQHAAIDIAAPVGSTCLSAVTGVVKSRFFDTEGGNILEIEGENGWLTRYVHLDRFFVQAGEVVVIGQEVALTGNTGSATAGPHLHFAVWHKEKDAALLVQADPYAYRNSGYWAVDPLRILKEEIMSISIVVLKVKKGEQGAGLKSILHPGTGRTYEYNKDDVAALAEVANSSKGEVKLVQVPVTRKTFDELKPGQ